MTLPAPRKSLKHAVLLDSGAYSAWNRGESIDLHRYVEFIHEHRDVIWHAVNLDTIPGRRGVRPSSTVVEESARASWKNAIEMRRLGVEAIPVFHMGEDFKWLRRMIDGGFTYIGVGMGGRRNVAQRRAWLDEVFGVLCGGRHPPVKVHAFGATTMPLITRYPWASADALSWILLAAHGMVLVPKSNAAGYDYTVTPYSLPISHGPDVKRAKGMIRLRKDKAIPAQSMQGWHYAGLAETSRAYILKYLDMIGMDLDIVRNDFAERTRANVRFFQELERQHAVTKFGRASSSLFARHHDCFGCDTPPADKFRLTYTMNGSNTCGRILTDEKCKYVLVSYYFFVGPNPFDFRHYARTGKVRRGMDKSRLDVRVNGE